MEIGRDFAVLNHVSLSLCLLSSNSGADVTNIKISADLAFLAFNYGPTLIQGFVIFEYSTILIGQICENHKTSN